MSSEHLTDDDNWHISKLYQSISSTSLSQGGESIQYLSSAINNLRGSLKRDEGISKEKLERYVLAILTGCPNYNIDPEHIISQAKALIKEVNNHGHPEQNQNEDS